MVNTLNHKSKTRNNKTKIIIGCLLGLCLLGGIVAAAFFSNKSNDENNPNSTASPESTAESQISPSATPAPATPDPNNDGDNKTPTKYEGEDPNSGSDLTLSYANTAQIFADVSTSSCDGFAIPVSELSGGTNWTISIALASGDKSGVITGETRI